MTGSVWQWLRGFAELIYPKLCAVCGGALVEGEKTMCTTCRWDMPLTDYWVMPDNYVCELLAGRVDYRHASALMFFSKGSDYQAMIHRMKYANRRDIAVAMGEVYGHFLASSPLYKDVEVLVPVPLHWTKRISRGYNQAELLCDGMARSMGISVQTKALRRVRRTQTQARKRDKQERWHNVDGAFCVVRPELLQGKGVMLVDDVLTTGATTEAASRALSASPISGLWVGALAVVRRTKPKK